VGGARWIAKTGGGKGLQGGKVGALPQVYVIKTGKKTADAGLKGAAAAIHLRDGSPKSVALWGVLKGPRNGTRERMGWGNQAPVWASQRLLGQ